MSLVAWVSSAPPASATATSAPASTGASLTPSPIAITHAPAREIARETLATLRQNHRWALVYNLAAMPLAALGLVHPWLAAAGMSASSIAVVLNSLRIGRRREHELTAEPGAAVTPRSARAT